jgi:proteasome lid subunit RPN8/RPN11
MRYYLDAAHGDLMVAVGDYHSHTPALNAAYRAKVLAMAARMFGGRGG